MLELLTGPLGLVLTAAVLWWGITFNSRLEKRYHCTACAPWGIAGGIAGVFCWMLVWGQPLTLETAAARHNAGAVFQQPGKIRQRLTGRFDDGVAAFFRAGRVWNSRNAR